MIRENFPTLDTHSVTKDGESLIQIFLSIGMSKSKREKLDI